MFAAVCECILGVHRRPLVRLYIDTELLVLQGGGIGASRHCETTKG